MPFVKSIICLNSLEATRITQFKTDTFGFDSRTSRKKFRKLQEAIWSFEYGLDRSFSYKYFI